MKRIATLICLLIMIAVMAFGGQMVTRGVGVYPGNPAEDFAPTLVPYQINYRNLALLRPAFHSSSYDYNLTAQLVTDGIRESSLPRWLTTTYSQGGVAKKNEREFLLDHNVTSNVNLGGPEGWLQFELAGGNAPLEIDQVTLQASFRAPRAAGGPGSAGSTPQQQATSPGDWTCVVTGSEDGQTWKELGRADGAIPPPPPPSFFGPSGSAVEPSIPLTASSRSRMYRIALKTAAPGTWIVSEVSFFNQNKPVEAGGPYHFSSAWMSEGKGEEWVYVDLGGRLDITGLIRQKEKNARAIRIVVEGFNVGR